MKSRYILIAALIMAIVTTVLFRQYLKQLDRKYTNTQNMTEIIVAKQDIKKNQKVTRDMLEQKIFNTDSVHPQAVKKFSEIEGNYAITDIKAGEILFASRFTNQFKEQGEIERKIREGYRAISIEVNFVESVSTMIEPEDYVDVVWSEKIQNPSDNIPVKTQLLLENVRVLAVGTRIVNSEDLTAAAGTGQKADQVEYNSITLELKPEDIVKITNADERGDLKFALRSKIAPN